MPVFEKQSCGLGTFPNRSEKVIGYRVRTLPRMRFKALLLDAAAQNKKDKLVGAFMNMIFRPLMSNGLGVESTAILLRWLLEPETRDFAIEDLTVVTAMVGAVHLPIRVRKSFW